VFHVSLSSAYTRQGVIISSQVVGFSVLRCKDIFASLSLPLSFFQRLLATLSLFNNFFLLWVEEKKRQKTKITSVQHSVGHTRGHSHQKVRVDRTSLNYYSVVRSMHFR